MDKKCGPIYNTLGWKGISLKRTLLILCCLLLTTFSCSDNNTTNNSVENEITDIIRQFHDYFDKKDFRTLSTLCTDDMFWYALNGEAITISSLPGFFLPIMSSWTSAKTTLSDLEFNVNEGIVAVRYKSQIDIKTSTGEHALNNLHTSILIKTETGWKIWHHHMSNK